MLRNKLIGFALLSTLVLSGRPAGAQAGPTSGLYQIVSGRHLACCGFGGEIVDPLPNVGQAFVELTVDPQSQRAQLTFLGQDMRTVFRILPVGARSGFTYRLSGGRVFPDHIEFGAPPPPPTPEGPYHYYTVSNAAGALRIDGVVALEPVCCDIPTTFTHTNVVAVLMPTAAIRCSEVEVCWNAVSNRTYQVQYRSAFTTNAWINLGGLVAGNGATNCLADRVPPGQPQRFYRVLTRP